MLTVAQEQLRRRPVIEQFVKFGLVGVLNTLLTLAVTLLLNVAGVYYIAASGIGFLVGTVNSFLLNRSWTFRGHRGDALTPVRWFVVQGVGLALDLALVYALVDSLGLAKLAGQAVAIVVVVVLTFFANRTWTFRMTAPTAAAAGAVGEEAGQASAVGVRQRAASHRAAAAGGVGSEASEGAGGQL